MGRDSMGKTIITGVSISFSSRATISLAVAFKGLNVILGLYKCNHSLIVTRKVGPAARCKVVGQIKRDGGPDLARGLCVCHLCNRTSYRPPNRLLSAVVLPAQQFGFTQHLAEGQTKTSIQSHSMVQRIEKALLLPFFPTLWSHLYVSSHCLSLMAH